MLFFNFCALRHSGRALDPENGGIELEKAMGRSLHTRIKTKRSVITAIVAKLKRRRRAA
ncbi:hypothetical protein [Noviherbaspirillum galbum]|uniref:Uncharacterized protein n=1 Tax=Noviherbaspirillum galbum TaxID=2709383 RepID=A0A6B3SVS1_9BURK|nr:hypothetical protein [Noviherbaspirillum galbum]NEX64847.1 hypothetical protein [Noviherbaspirillum galbum]